MGFKCGIVGLPNVGKSTLFNALTKAGIDAANYPFCTIEPNVGMVTMPDPRLDVLAEIVQPQKVVPTTMKFVDIAGLVKGAAKGEGLGNQFLAHIRETDAIAHVVRCFADDDIIHVSGEINPIDDIEVINTELALADLESVEKALAKLSKMTKAGDKQAIADHALLSELKQHLDKGLPIRSYECDEETQARIAQHFFITSKPVLYITNVSESGFENNPYLEQVSEYAAKENAQVVPICAAIESEIVELDADDKKEFLSDLGLEEPGLNRVIRAGYDLLGLQTYFTAGVKEVRAWTIKKGVRAPDAAGVIHTDFSKGFIRAEVIAYPDFVEHKGEAGAKAAGKLRVEGKEYFVQDGDIMHFLFNV